MALKEFFGLKSNLDNQKPSTETPKKENVNDKESINNNEVNEEKKYKNEEEFLKVIKDKSIEEAVLNIDEYRGLSQKTFNKILKNNQRLIGVLYNNLSSFTNLKAFDYKEKSYPLFKKETQYKSSSIETAFEKGNPEKVLEGIVNGAFDNPLYSGKSAKLIVNKCDLPGLEFVAANIDNLVTFFNSSEGASVATKLIENGSKMSEIVLHPSFSAIHNSRGFMSIINQVSPENKPKAAKFLIDNLDLFKKDFNLVITRQWRTANESMSGPNYHYHQSVECFPEWTELAEILIKIGAQDLLKENLAKFSNKWGSLSEWDANYLIEKFEKTKDNNQESESA